MVLFIDHDGEDFFLGNHKSLAFGVGCMVVTHQMTFDQELLIDTVHIADVKALAVFQKIDL